MIAQSREWAPLPAERDPGGPTQPSRAGVLGWVCRGASDGECRGALASNSTPTPSTIAAPAASSTRVGCVRGAKTGAGPAAVLRRAALQMVAPTARSPALCEIGRSTPAPAARAARPRGGTGGRRRGARGGPPNRHAPRQCLRARPTRRRGGPPRPPPTGRTPRRTFSRSRRGASPRRCVTAPPTCSARPWRRSGGGWVGLCVGGAGGG